MVVPALAGGREGQPVVRMDPAAGGIRDKVARDSVVTAPEGRDVVQVDQKVVLAVLDVVREARKGDQADPEGDLIPSGC